MARKPPVLINVPRPATAPASDAAELEAMRSSLEQAASELRAKIDQDRRRRDELIEGITDKAMRNSLKKQ